MTKQIAWIATSVLMLSLSTASNAGAADNSQNNKTKSPDSAGAESSTCKNTETKGSDAPKTSNERQACKISTVMPFECDAESTRVIKVVENITAALSARNFTKMAEYMDEHCTNYNASTKKTIDGRDAVIADVKKRVQAEEARDHVRALSFKIDRPFAQVHGEDAVVSFVLVKEIGGPHPKTFEEHCTDVFVKRGSEWKKLQFRGGPWKRVK